MTKDGSGKAQYYRSSRSVSTRYVSLLSCKQAATLVDGGQ